MTETPVGVAEIIYQSKCPIRQIVTPELSKFYLLQSYHGKEISKNLLNLVEESVFNKGYQELWLEVYVHNPRAIAFYKKNGFKIIGNVDFPMQDNTYKNYVMTKTIKF